MNFELMQLPFAQDALEPHISARTISYHYDKHHRGYLNKLEAALRDDERRSLSLEEIIENSDGRVFNCAAQVWNHDFYWHSIDPTGASQPSAALGACIERCFGTLDALKDALKATGAGEFGSGWAWLGFDPQASKLVVSSTTDAENPMLLGTVPLLTIDVWEHAYYLDRQNDRGAYLQAFLDHLLNWDFASANFAAAQP